jgi:hypothetical protein
VAAVAAVVAVLAAQAQGAALDGVGGRDAEDGA